MNIYFGTYSGEVILLSGIPSNLEIKRKNQVSQTSIRCMYLPEGSRQLLIGGFDQELKAIDRDTIVQKKQCKEPKGIINCIQKINQTVVAVGLDNGLIQFWDWKNWNLKREVKEHKKSIRCIERQSNGVLVASVSSKSMIFWNPLNYQSIFHYKFDYDIQHVLFDNSFQHIFLINSRQIHHLKAEDNTQLHCHKLQLSESIQSALLFDQYLLIGSDKGEIYIWKFGDYQHKIFYKAHNSRIKILKKFCFDEVEYLLTASSSGQVRIWDILQFLKQVDKLSQDYQMNGLQPICSIQTGKRLICGQIYIEDIQKQSSKIQTIQPKQNSKVGKAKSSKKSSVKNKQFAQHQKSQRSQKKKKVKKIKKLKNKNKKIE